MKHIIAVLLLLSFGFSQAQKAKIHWGEFFKSNSYVNPNILPIGENQFFDLNFNEYYVRKAPTIRHCKNNKVVNELKFEGSAPGKGEVFKYFKLVGEQAILFSTSRERDVMSFYAYVIDKSLKSSKLQKLISHKMEYDQAFDFAVEVSENGDFFAVLLTTDNKKTDIEAVEYVVYTKEFEQVLNGKYELPYSRLECDVDQHHISNTGDYFVSYKVYETNKNGKVKDHSLLKKYVIKQVNDYEKEDYEIKPEKGSVRYVYFQTNEQGSLTLTGLWGPKSEQVSGVFNMIIDFKARSIKFEEFHQFNKKFILEAWSDKKQEKFEKNEANGKNKDSEPVLVNFKIRGFIRQKDGSTIVLTEQSDIRVAQSIDSKGNASHTHYYYENGIIAYKIFPDGTIDWTTYIHKEQVTKSDNGYAISFGYLYNEDQIVLFFHDNKKNYSENGKYNNEKHKTNFNKQNYCFAQASIDTKTGYVTRTILHDYKTAGEGFVLPRFTVRQNDPSTGIMIMLKKFSTTRKYGSVSL